MKNALLNNTKEIRSLFVAGLEVVLAGLKLAAIFGPILLGTHLGLPSYDLQEFVALSLVVTGVAIGVKLLRD